MRNEHFISMELDNAMSELESAADRVAQIALFDIQRYEQIEKMLLATTELQKFKGAKRSVRSNGSIVAIRQCHTGKRSATRISKAAKAYRMMLRNARRIPRVTAQLKGD